MLWVSFCQDAFHGFGSILDNPVLDWNEQGVHYTVLHLMATYVYETIPQKKGQKARRFEVEQKMSDDPLTHDPETGMPCKRIIVGGSGWVTHGSSILSMNVKSGR